uniref:hypothetical protein n=1 Tax=Klebsiella oxytoca TaxID=571 RepID=UPI0019541935
ELPSEVFRLAGDRMRREADKAFADFAGAAELAGVICETMAMTVDPHDAEKGLARLAGHFDMTVVEQVDPESPAAGNELAEIALF